MPKNWKERTELLLNKTQMQILQNAHVLVVGLGGVGSYAAETLVRAGIGQLTIVDGDVVDITNINRQLQAVQSTIGQSKAHLMANRLLDINPELKLTVIDNFLEPQDMEKLLQQSFSYVIDAIDSVSPKMNLLKNAVQNHQKIVSSMGAGGKMNPTKITIADICKTTICPLAQHIRKNLRYEGIKKGIDVVFSTELADRKSVIHTDGRNFKKSAYGTISYLPAMFGMTCASLVIRNLVEWIDITPQQNAKN